jgi:hypothetical protein
MFWKRNEKEKGMKKKLKYEAGREVSLKMRKEKQVLTQNDPQSVCRTCSEVKHLSKIQCFMYKEGRTKLVSHYRSTINLHNSHRV